MIKTGQTAQKLYIITYMRVIRRAYAKVLAYVICHSLSIYNNSNNSTCHSV